MKNLINMIITLICITMLFTACSLSKNEPATAPTPVPAETQTETPTSPSDATPTPTAAPTSTPTPEPVEKTVTLYLPDAASGIIQEHSENVTIGFETSDAQMFEELFKRNISEDYDPLITKNTKINLIQIDSAKSLAAIDLSKEFISELDAGAGTENDMLNCIANTIGKYYGVNNVQITIDGKRYESGHIILEIGDYIKVE